MITLADQILDAALPNVIFDGWTMKTLEIAAISIGKTIPHAKLAFPGGVADALALFNTRADEQMLEELRTRYDLKTMKIRERIATAVMVRLRQQQADREIIRRAQGFYALPWNVPAAMKSMFHTVDAIWHEAGDTATDYNYYTKRLMLAGVLKSTVTVWLDDESDDLAETKAFLDRRIGNVMSIEKAKAGVKKQLAKLEEWLPAKSGV